MIYGISGWTMIGGAIGLFVRGHSVHLIIEIIVRTLARLRDGLSIPRVMRGEVRVSAP